MARESSDCVLCRPRLETPVLRETHHWRIAVNRNQNLLGKLFISLQRHEDQVVRLSDEEWGALRGEIAWATEQLRGAFAPDHFNYSFLQNQDRHVHLHVIPRYASPRRIAGSDFDDLENPNHYGVGVDRRLGSDVIAAISAAIVGA